MTTTTIRVRKAGRTVGNVVTTSVKRLFIIVALVAAVIAVLTTTGVIAIFSAIH